MFGAGSEELTVNVVHVAEGTGEVEVEGGAGVQGAVRKQVSRTSHLWGMRDRKRGKPSFKLGEQNWQG